MLGGPEALQPWCTLLHHASNGSRRLVGPTPVTVFPQRRPTHEPAATNVKFFGSEPMRMLGPPSSGAGKHAISQIGVQGPLWTTQHWGVPATYPTSWVVLLYP